jgi:hypothetical protein
MIFLPFRPKTRLFDLGARSVKFLKRKDQPSSASLVFRSADVLRDQQVRNDEFSKGFFRRFRTFSASELANRSSNMSQRHRFRLYTHPVGDTKSGKDSMTMLGKPLERHLQKIKAQHEEDLEGLRHRVSAGA